MTTSRTELRKRHIMPEIEAALQDTRVILIAGARQVGKSTVAEMALSQRSEAIRLTLDDAQTVAAAREDPTGFVQHSGIMLIDEVQRVPELFLAIKAAVDRSRRPGQFLLTGSANIFTLPKVADALPGRMEIINLWPFSQGEIEGQFDSFVDWVFNESGPTRLSTNLSKIDYIERAVRGGFPDVVSRTDKRRRDAWFESYISTLIERDMRDLADIAHSNALPRLLKLLAARSAQPLSIRNLATDVDLAPNTLSRYVDLLESAFIITRLPGWETSKTTRATRVPKIFIRDSGLLCHLLGGDSTALMHQLGDAGPVLETFVSMEVARQLEWSTTRATIHHYRNRDGIEIDAILEASNGRIVGIEVKASSTLRARDFAGLHHVAKRTGDRFHAGIVFYTGPDALPFGHRMWGLPISALWNN